MARRPTAKREKIAVRLAAFVNGQWVEPDFSFIHKREAYEYRERHWPTATKWKVWHVRMRADFGIDRDYRSKAALGQGKEQTNASK